MDIITGSVSTDGKEIHGKGFNVEVQTVKNGWTTFCIYLTNNKKIENYSVVCQKGPIHNDDPLLTAFTGENLLQVVTKTQGVKPGLMAFNFIAVRYN
ncbi:hypothetical protein [Xanthovirga aplysinae]|uniref:hypothetical protein n=1 Tax=Xanthovirga aplysinae TaxID=2529853 RepID=UPI0012BCCE00|nr:hypothetical protein [Xanthovirga aplysinae]MTI32499.1 hypothetical protein [Xanthovirga aplysinae]